MVSVNKAAWLELTTNAHGLLDLGWSQLGQTTDQWGSQKLNREVLEMKEPGRHQKSEEVKEEANMGMQILKSSD